jgi:2-amino-4-hydroxy-6-hydroxymethyldihydropteridine diphosphokinase
METVYLLMGTNLGDRSANLKICLAGLMEIGEIIAVSPIYQCKAWGNQDQPDFFNQAIAIETKKSPEESLLILLKIEKAIGRVRRERWGSRIIDIDILLFGNRNINSENLTVPHPHLPERKFALIPLNDIAPDMIHPVLNKSIRELLLKCTDPLEVKRF